MSKALERDIRNALADLGRSVDADATLTTAVRELIAAAREAEEDRDANARAYNDINNRFDSVLTDLRGARADLAEARALLARQPAASAAGPAVAFVIIAALALSAFLVAVLS